MVFGVGVDIERHHRFVKYPEMAENNDLSLFFSTIEINNYTQIKDYLCYAVSFCAKEAFFKAFSSRNSRTHYNYTDVEVFFTDRPNKMKSEITCSGAMAKTIDQYNISIQYNYMIYCETVIFEVILLCHQK